MLEPTRWALPRTMWKLSADVLRKTLKPRPGGTSSNPIACGRGFKSGTKLGALGMLAKTMLTRAPRLDAFEASRGRPQIADATLAHENESWLATARQRDLNLLDLMPHSGTQGDAEPSP